MSYFLLGSGVGGVLLACLPVYICLPECLASRRNVLAIQNADGVIVLLIISAFLVLLHADGLDLDKNLLH